MVESGATQHQPPAEKEKKPDLQPASCAELAAFVTEAGFTFDHFIKFVSQEKLIADADSLAGFEQIKESDAKRLMRAGPRMLNGLKAIKEGGA